MGHIPPNGGVCGNGFWVILDDPARAEILTEIGIGFFSPESSDRVFKLWTKLT